MNETLKKVLHWIRSLFKHQKPVPTPPRPKAVVNPPSGSRYRRKGRTPGAFGSCEWLKLRETPRYKTRLKLGDPDPEQVKKARQRRKRIRRRIKAA